MSNPSTERPIVDPTVAINFRETDLLTKKSFNGILTVGGKYCKPLVAGLGCSIIPLLTPSVLKTRNVTPVPPGRALGSTSINVFMIGLPIGNHCKPLWEY